MSAIKQKKERVSREELRELKARLGIQLEVVYQQVMAYCTGRPPPLKAISGSYQDALDFKDLVGKTRGLILNKSGSPNQLQSRINRFSEKLAAFKKFD